MLPAGGRGWTTGTEPRTAREGQTSVWRALPPNKGLEATAQHAKPQPQGPTDLPVHTRRTDWLRGPRSAGLNSLGVGVGAWFWGRGGQRAKPPGPGGTHGGQLPEQVAQLRGLPDHPLGTLLALLCAAEGDALLHDGAQVLQHHAPLRLRRHPLRADTGSARSPLRSTPCRDLGVCPPRPPHQQPAEADSVGTAEFLPCHLPEPQEHSLQCLPVSGERKLETRSSQETPPLGHRRGAGQTRPSSHLEARAQHSSDTGY